LPGKSSEIAAATCTDCAPGRFSDVPGALCAACDPGTFNPAPGAQECAACGVGRFASDLGSSACTDCAPGRFAAVPGQGLCLNCPAGRFVETAAGATCEDCSPGRFQADVGQTVCETCPSGTRSLDEGAASCLQCARFAARSLVKLDRIGTDLDPANDGLRLTSNFQLVQGTFADIDPATFGARILLFAQDGTRTVDLPLLPGSRADRRSSGWEGNKKGTAWKYTGVPSPTSPGPVRLLLVDRSKELPGLVRISLTAPRGHFPTVAADVPLAAVVVVGEGTCGESGFTPEECFFARSGKALTCSEKGAGLVRGGPRR
jgi:Tyrosine-protein kinase ephrin type A/B receptor-like